MDLDVSKYEHLFGYDFTNDDTLVMSITVDPVQKHKLGVKVIFYNSETWFQAKSRIEQAKKNLLKHCLRKGYVEEVL